MGEGEGSEASKEVEELIPGKDHRAGTSLLAVCLFG